MDFATLVCVVVHACTRKPALVDAYDEVTSQHNRDTSDRRFISAAVPVTVLFYRLQHQQ